MGLPYRSAGSFCGSKLPDAQAAYETSNSLQMGLLSGVNFMLHACGWLEGGMVASFEKFVMDADQLGALHHMARGIAMDENAQAMNALREVGPGHEVVAEAANGSEAIDMVRELQPDVVLMDINMPEMDGVTATRVIRRQFPQIQVVALTSFKDKGLVQDALQHLIKP